MSDRKLIIDPVTRIEGHAKITLIMDEAGNISDARFHVVEFRGFEKFCEGRPMSEMPAITARICGICPVSHLLASAKACDAILAIDIPPAAEKLRRLMNLAQIIQSHSLSFFYLSAPDLLLGKETSVSLRNLFGLFNKNPELVRRGIKLRQFGQQIIKMLGGQRIHPPWAIAGGVRSHLSLEARDIIKASLPYAFETIHMALEIFMDIVRAHVRAIQIFGNFPSLFMGLVTKDGLWEHYDGYLRFVDSSGSIIEDKIEPTLYRQYIGEAVESDSYLKSPYFIPLGYPDGMYRVGPLARLNVCERIGTPQADAELEKFRRFGKGAVTSSFFYHYARLIEILACLEKIQQMIDDPDLTEGKLRANAGVNRLEGIGVSEAPRGTLFHHYHVDENGIIRKVNLIIATGQNNLAMNRTIAQIAKYYVKGGSIDEAILNWIEAGIRAYDPCLSCSTHAIGSIPLVVELVDHHARKIKSFSLPSLH